MFARVYRSTTAGTDPALADRWRELSPAGRRWLLGITASAVPLVILAANVMPGPRVLPAWVVLVVLFTSATASMLVARTTGLHRGGRNVMIVPVGQYFFAAAVLLYPGPIAVLAIAAPTWSRLASGIAVRMQRLFTTLSASAMFWALFGDAHPRLNGDESWGLVLPLVAGIATYLLVDAVLASATLRFVQGVPWRESGIWSAYSFLRSSWEVTAGAVGAVLTLVHPAFSVLLIPLGVLVVEHVRLEHVSRLARIDPRTELLNVRGFQEFSALEIERAQTLGTDLSILVMDLDHLRNINNSYGHRVGDVVIAEVGHRILRTARRNDVVARIGGEEFTALLPDASGEIALRVGERYRAAVSDEPFQTSAGPLTITISVGVAQWTADESVDELYERADAALYAAKSAGRNRVHGAPCCGPATE